MQQTVGIHTHSWYIWNTDKKYTHLRQGAHTSCNTQVRVGI